MRRLLVPVDGSAQSLKAAKYAGEMARDGATVHLLNVQGPLPSAVSDFLANAERRSFHRDEGEVAMREVRAALDAAGVRHESHVAVGPVAETVVAYAREAGCDHIVMGSRGLSPIPNLLLGSVVTRVLHLAEIPVTIVR